MGTKVIPATLFCRRARAASLTVTASSTKIYTRLDSCLVIPPPPIFKKPRAIIKFLGGAFVGAVPELTYRFFYPLCLDGWIYWFRYLEKTGRCYFVISSYLKELLAKEGYLIVSVPYNVTFDHEQAAKQVYQRFNSCLDAIVLSGVQMPIWTLKIYLTFLFSLLVTGSLLVSSAKSVHFILMFCFSILWFLCALNADSNGALLQVLTGSYFSDKIPKVWFLVN